MHVPLTIVSSPPPTKGRPKLAGTVLRAPDGREYAVVRLVFSGGYNTANTRSPRVELWVALSTDDFHPIIVRGSSIFGAPLEWHEIPNWRDLYSLRIDDFVDAIRKAEHVGFTGVLIDKQNDTRPRSINDQRIVLPGDDGFPKHPPYLGESITELLNRRNTCPDDEVGAIDAQILNLAPRRE